MGETHEIRKEYEYQASRNLDLGTQVRDYDLKIKDKEDQLYAIRKDLEHQKFTNSQVRDNNAGLLSEKEALEKHAYVLQSQNEGITRELDQFCETDEQVRHQLDRRGKVHGIRSKNEGELQKSFYRIEEVRSRSPTRRSPNKKY